jgi:hypothetical protein
MDFTIFDHREHIPTLNWIGKKDWIIYEDIPSQRAIKARPRRFVFHNEIAASPQDIVVSEKEFNSQPTMMWKVFHEIINVIEFDVVGTLWYYTLSKSLADGPKIFQPTALQCEALENAEARYSFKDYKQPFPVIILEIPENYREQLKEKYKIEESPKYVFVHHDEKNHYIAVSAFYNKNNIITHITPDREEYETIEDSIVRNRNRRQGYSHQNEFDAAENVQRLGINFAMMMSLYTVKVGGPLDPTNYKIWTDEAKATKRGGIPTRKASEAKQKLLATINILEFDQKVSFYDEIEEQIEVAQNTDIEKLHKSPKSHWRRGHFAMQAHGVGRRERKMIFRKPVLIRAKYFIGENKNTSVTYTMKNKDT